MGKKKDKNKAAEARGVRKMTEDERKSLNFFISTPLKSAKKLAESLFASDEFYESATYAWTRPEDAKKLFLYGVCKQVMRTCIELMQNVDFLKEVPTGGKKDNLEKIVYGSVLEGQDYRLRKMIELLSLMILFRKNSKADEEYRIYLSAENLDTQISRQKEFKEFYDGEIVLNTQHSVDDFIKRINDDLKTLGLTDIWFLDANKLTKQEPSVFKSKRNLYLQSLLVASDDERMALGVSYHKTYSRLSLSTHPLMGSYDYGDKENDHKSVVSNVSFISIACMHIMYIAYKIANLEDGGGIEKIMGTNFEKSHAQKNMSALKKDFKAGDIVLTAWTDLAEIVSGKESKYGYKAYKVRYLSRAPIPEHTEDWLESQHILTKLIEADKIKEFYVNSLEKVENADLKKDMQAILSQPDEFLLESAKATFLDLHKNGILIPMLIQSGHLKRMTKEEII